MSKRPSVGALALVPLLGAALGACSTDPTPLVDVKAAFVTTRYYVSTSSGEPVAGADVEVSFPEAHQVLRDACPHFTVTVTVNGHALPVTSQGGPTPSCASETGDCSGFCQTIYARGVLPLLAPGPLDVVVSDASASFHTSSSNLVSPVTLTLSAPAPASPSEPGRPLQVVLEASAPVHLFASWMNGALGPADDPDPLVPRLIVGWNLANDFPHSVQVDPTHVRIPIPATSASSLPAIWPSLIQERPRFEVCEGFAVCGGESTTEVGPLPVDLPHP